MGKKCQWNKAYINIILLCLLFCDILPRLTSNHIKVMLIYDLFHWHSSPLHLIYFLMIFISPPKIPRPFFNECPQRKTLSDGWINSLFFYFIYNIYCCYSYDVQPGLIYMILILPVTILYMILILPHNCLIYDPEWNDNWS